MPEHEVRARTNSEGYFTSLYCPCGWEIKSLPKNVSAQSIAETTNWHLANPEMVDREEGSSS